MPRKARLLVALLVTAAIATLSLGCRTPTGETREEKRASVRKMREEALADLYQDNSSAKGLIGRSEGYAVFSSIGTNFGLISSARGFGILKDRKSGADSYMEMQSLGGGFGLGVRDFRVFFIFLDRGAIDDFLKSGIEFAGQANATATSEEEEGIDLNAAQNLDSDLRHSRDPASSALRERSRLGTGVRAAGGRVDRRHGAGDGGRDLHTL
jgi:lipid-binding SYLF domain-containing protein